MCDTRSRHKSPRTLESIAVIDPKQSDQIDHDLEPDDPTFENITETIMLLRHQSNLRHFYVGGNPRREMSATCVPDHLLARKEGEEEKNLRKSGD